MKTLLLTSAGMQVKEEIIKILPKSANQIKVAHIITASKPELDLSYVKNDRKNMQKLGFKVKDIDIESKTKLQLENILSDFDIIYVQGGNTFYLLKAVRESGFDQILNDLLEKGIIYIGVSAGSVLMGASIETSGWKNADKNEVGIKDLTGLNMVPFSLFVHYKKDWDEAIKKGKEKLKTPLRILRDSQAFLVKDNQVELVGESPEVRL